MTITKDDIKLMASERLTDDADGGGFMTGTVIQDGVENNIFPDVSELDRAQGANDFRKFYLAVMELGANWYYGAHLIIDALAADPNISATLYGSASQDETRQEFIDSVDTVGISSKFRGTKTLTVDASIGDREVKADGTTVQVIPNSNVGTPITGAVLPSSDQRTIIAPWSTTIPAPTFTNGSGPRNLNFMHYAIAGTVTGSITAGGSFAISEVDALAYQDRLEKDSTPLTGLFQSGGGFPGARVMFMDLAADITVNSVVYKPAFPIDMPITTQSFTWTNGMLYTQEINLPYVPHVGGEVVIWTNLTGGEESMTTFGMLSNDQPNALMFIDRAAKKITITFKAGHYPKPGTPVTTQYVRTGYLQPLAFSALGNSGTFAAGILDVTPTSGWDIAYASFKLGGAYYKILGNEVLTFDDDVAVGAYNRTLHRILLGGHDGQTVSEWLCIEKNSSIPVTTIVDAATEPNMTPNTVTIEGNKSAGGTFSVTADSTGAFISAFANGTYNKTDGKVNMTFTAAVDVESLTFEGDKVAYTPVPEEIAGFDPSNFSVDGTVDVFPFGVVTVVHNTQALAPQTVVNAQVVNCGRTLLSDIRIFGDDGAEILTGFTPHKAAGTVTINDITGWDQPIVVTHRIEDMAVVIARDVSGLLTLSKPLSHNYPADESYVSSALIIGDMQARAHPGFQMQTWTGVWADTLADTGGVAILADYNEPAYPIVMENKGGIKERWLIRFTNSSAFTVTGEQVGQIAVGDTTTTCAPINPATGRPYFSINPAGWGSGWATGNAYRFNTDGGSEPAWVIRTINPSDPWPTQDRITVAARGSINA